MELHQLPDEKGDRYMIATDPFSIPIDWKSRCGNATTDLDRARLLRDFIRSLGRDVLHVKVRGFYLYEDGVWTSDAEDRIHAYIHEMSDEIRQVASAAYADSAAIEDEDAQKAAMTRAGRILKVANLCRQTRGARSLLEQLQVLEGVAGARIEEFDAKPDLLAVANGFLDLRTGELHPYDELAKYQRLSQKIDVPYDHWAQCPRWERFLEEILITEDGSPDYELIDWMQKLVGYGITGHTSEQMFAVLYGIGANGRSTFLETIGELFAPIVRTSPFSAFEQKSNTSIPNDIARLVDARLVFANEGDQRSQISPSTIKRLTGQDTISARFLNREFFEFKPRFLIMLASNHKPAVQDSSEGYWRRVKLVRFRRYFEEHERDGRLKDALREEFPGILAWAVRGAVNWNRDGRLIDPGSVRRETQIYRTSTDRLSEFVDSCLEITGEHMRDWAKVTEVQKAYLAWADDNGEEHPLRRSTLLSQLSERRGVRHDIRHKQAILRGVKLLTPAEQKSRQVRFDRQERPLTAVSAG